MNASEILQKAQEAMSSRAKERDMIEERSMKRIVQLFNIVGGYELTERDGWLFMVCLKLARASTTPHGVEDDYTDGAAYFALAGESVQCGEKLWIVPQSISEETLKEAEKIDTKIDWNQQAAKAAKAIPCTQIMPQEEWTELQKKYIATYGEPRN